MQQSHTSFYQITLILLGSLLLTACSSSDNDNTSNKTELVPQALIGDWNYTSYSEYQLSLDLIHIFCNSINPRDPNPSDCHNLADNGVLEMQSMPQNELWLYNSFFTGDNENLTPIQKFEYTQSSLFSSTIKNTEKRMKIDASGELTIEILEASRLTYTDIYCQGVELPFKVNLQLEPNFQIKEANNTTIQFERDLSVLEPSITMIDIESEQVYCSVPLSYLSHQNIDHYNTMIDSLLNDELILSTYPYATAETLEVEYRLSEEDDQAVLYLDKLFDINGPSDLVDAKYIKIEHNETDENDSTE